MAVEWFGFLYAALLSAGGVVGYLKAGSVLSLAAGLLFGLLAGVGAYLASHSPRNERLLKGTAATVTVIMGLRFITSMKFMPAGLLTILGVLLLAKLQVGPR